MSNNTRKCNPGLDCNNGNDSDCCSSKVICKKPKYLKDISMECIFVEKVFDARKSNTELQFGFFPGIPLNVSIEPTDLESIETINVKCNILSLVTITESVRINDEFFDVSTTVPGPGGDQVVLNREQLRKILDPTCVKEDKGTKVQLDIFLRLVVDFEIVVTGTGIDSNGLLVPFTGSQLFNDIFLGVTLSFKDFCIPPLSFFPVSLISSCLMNCAFVLTDFEFSSTSDTVGLIGSLFFCITCETLLKAPSQICALTTGSCKIKESKAFCDDDDFPDNLSSLVLNRNNTDTTSMKNKKKANVSNEKPNINTPIHHLSGSFGTNQFNTINPKSCK